MSDLHLARLCRRWGLSGPLAEAIAALVYGEGHE